MDEFINTEEEDEAPSAPFWMTTFSDMVTLLLTFFVLIVSMSEVEVVKFREALSHFNGQKSIMDFPSVVAPTVPQENIEEVYEAREVSLDELIEYLRENNLEDKVLVNLTVDGVHVSIVDSVMFESGRATLLPTAETILRKVAEVLTPLARSISVEGHTDNRPIQTVHFPSNWELSGARASSVVRFFLNESTALGPEKYQTIGYAEFRPEVSNDTPAGRARNRRVEIHFRHAGE
ncbi:MAG: OmpA family protein [Rhodothermales bacterium]